MKMRKRGKEENGKEILLIYVIIDLSLLYNFYFILTNPPLEQ